jgi:hypothetical protein
VPDLPKTRSKNTTFAWNRHGFVGTKMKKTLKKFNVLQVFPQTNPNISKYGVPGSYT